MQGGIAIQARPCHQQPKLQPKEDGTSGQHSVADDSPTRGAGYFSPDVLRHDQAREAQSLTKEQHEERYQAFQVHQAQFLRRMRSLLKPDTKHWFAFVLQHGCLDHLVPEGVQDKKEYLRSLLFEGQ